MLTSVELTRGLQQAGHDAHFIATGQTGIMVSGDGCPIDSVTADFVSGAVEKMLHQHQQHDILVIEGQGQPRASVLFRRHAGSVARGAARTP